MNNKESLQTRLAEYTATMQQYQLDGNHAMALKWEFEVNNIKRLIEMEKQNNNDNNDSRDSN